MTQAIGTRVVWRRVTATVGRVLDLLPRPLDPISSIKLKLSLLLVASGSAGVVVFWRGIGWFPFRTGFTALLVALLTSYVLAHGMTSPLREMTAAARAMARGDYTRQIRATSRDEVGELARAFNQMAADLAAADRQRRELIANVSHELRTPISALQGVLENLVDGVAEADPTTLRTALAQTERLGRLVAELLDLSRVEAGVVRLEREEIAVGPFLADAVAEATVTAAGAGRRVGFAVETSAGLVVSADRDRLHQVFANLLDNAARHSPLGGVVTVSARPEGVVAAAPAGVVAAVPAAAVPAGAVPAGAVPAGAVPAGAVPAGPADERGASRIVFEVADQGSGIPAEQRERVFERFSRGSRGDYLDGGSARDGGTGLGLAIAQWVVHLHGGTIEVADPDLPGCRIRATLPR